MEIIDKGILISKFKYGESGLIAKIFMENHGVYTGMINGAMSAKKVNICQISNLLDVIYKNKLDETLGYFKVEIKKSYINNFLHDKLKILMVYSCMELINNLILERENHNSLFYTTISFFENISISNYLKWEMILLQEIGFSLSLDSCFFCNKKNDLAFISPKTGKSACFTHGSSYKDKLFLMPDSLKNKYYLTNDIIENDILLLNKILEFFIMKFIKENLNKFLYSRKNLTVALNKHYGGELK